MRILASTRLSADGRPAFDQLLAAARHACDLGLELSTPQIFDMDALTAMAVVAREVPLLKGVCVAVVPTFGRHPIVMAMQALTVQAATNGRLTLGVGLSHPAFVEGCFGLSYDSPARKMREYLEILMPLLRDGQIDYDGVEYTAHTVMPMIVPGATPPTVLVAAMGTMMLQLTGELADGTSLWMVGRNTLESHIVPTLTAGAQQAGRPRPQVQVGLPVCVTSRPDAARERANSEFSFYPTQPAYRAMLDREGAAGPADVAAIGDDESVADELRRYEDAGATSFRPAVFGTEDEQARTYALLGELAAH